MQVRQLVVAGAVLALGTVARAESMVTCSFVDDFCVAPSHPRVGAAAQAAEAERSAAARPVIPANFVDDFGVAPSRQRVAAAAPAGSERSAARPLISCNFVDDFCVPGAAGDAAPRVAAPSGPGREAEPMRGPVARR